MHATEKIFFPKLKRNREKYFSHPLSFDMSEPLKFLPSCNQHAGRYNGMDWFGDSNSLQNRLFRQILYS